MEIKKLSQKELNEILMIDKVNPENGTLFGVSTRRKPGKRLMLVIGTGGCGKEVIRRTVLSADQKMNLSYKNYVRFLILDSALNELSVLDGMGIDYIATTCDGLTQRLNPPQGFFTDFVYNPYPVAMLNSDGASRMRMTGKIKYYDQPQAGITNDEILRNKINNLFSGPWSTQIGKQLDIMIISGTAGGNGSGSFMDIAASARQAVAGRANVKFYGFLMLPDTTESFANSPDDAKYMMANGFAALKELESYMSIPMEPGRKEIFKAPNSACDQVIDSATPLFDYPILVSGRYETAVSMISETLINFIGDSGGNFDARSFLSNYPTAKSAMLLESRVSQDGIVKPDEVPEDSHSYCAIGYAQASIPEEVVVPYIITRVCRKLFTIDQSVDVGKAFCTTEKKLSRVEFEDAMRTLLGLRPGKKLDANSLWNIIRQKEAADCRLPENNVDITAGQIIHRQCGHYEKGFLIEKTSNEAKKRFRKSLGKLFETFTENAKTVMYNYGPRAMTYLLYGNGTEANDGTAEYCISKQLKSCADHFNNEKDGVFPSADETPGFFKRLINLATKQIEGEYKQLASNAAQQKVYYKVAQVCRGDNGEWRSCYEKPVKDFFSACERFALVTERLIAMYQSNGTAMETNSFEKFAEKAEGVNGINLCNNQSIYDWIRNSAEMQINRVTLVNLKQELVDDFYSNRDSWVSTDPGKARKRFDDVLSRACHLGVYSTDAEGLKLSIDDYFTEVLRDVSPAEQMNRINETIIEIMDRLTSKSTPRLGGNKPSVGPRTEVVLVPKDLLTANAFSSMIQNAISGYFGNREHIVDETTTTDAIVCYQLSCGNPLCDIPDLTKWENIYDEVSRTSRFVHVTDSDRARLHQQSGYSQYKELTFDETQKQWNQIYMGKGADRQDNFTITGEKNSLLGTGLSWRNYPSVNIRRYHMSNQRVEKTAETEYLTLFEKKIKLAQEWRVIERVPDDKRPNTFRFYIHLIPSDAGNISPNILRRYTAKTKDGYFERGEQLFKYLKEKNPAAQGVWKQQIYLDGTPFFGTGGFDFSQAVTNLHWTREQVDQELEKYLFRMMRKATNLYQSLEDTMFRYYPLEMELENREVQVKKYNLADLFIKLYAAGCIHNAKKKWTVTTEVDRKGNSIDEHSLVDLSLKAKARLEGIEEKLYNDNLQIVIVFLHFLEEIENGMDIEEILTARGKVIDTISDEDYAQILKKRTDNLQVVLERIQDAFIVKTEDEETLSESIADKYDLHEDDYERAIEIEIFEEELRALISTLIPAEEEKEEDDDEDF